MVRLAGAAPAGERLTVRPQPEHLHVFDRASGRRIDPSGEESRQLILPLRTRLTRVSQPFQRGCRIRMPASPAASVPPLSPGEMQLLLSRAGLALNPGQVADLVLAWRQVAGLIAGMPHDRPLADDMALCVPSAAPGRDSRVAQLQGGSHRKEGQGARAARAPGREGKAKAKRRKRRATQPGGTQIRQAWAMNGQRAAVPHHRPGRQADRREATFAGRTGRRNCWHGSRRPTRG